MVHAPRPWTTSPPFPGLEDELPAGAPMDHPLFPVLWERTLMTVREIVTVGHPVLAPAHRRGRSGRRRIGARSRQLIADLIDTMRHANGAGLAANQIGVPLRVAVIEVNNNPRYPYKPPIPLTVVINPRDRAARRRAGGDQRGLPVGARTCAATCTATSTSACARSTSTATEHDEIKRGLTAGTYPARVRPPRRQAVPRPGRPTRRRSRRGSSSSASTATPSSQRITEFVERVGS